MQAVRRLTHSLPQPLILRPGQQKAIRLCVLSRNDLLDAAQMLTSRGYVEDRVRFRGSPHLTHVLTITGAETRT